MKLTPEDIADLDETRQATYADERLGEIAVVDGYGIRVGVWNGLLEVRDGLGKDRRTRRIARTDPVRRVLVLGFGSISTQAMSWCLERQLPFVITNTSQDEIAMIGAPVLYDHGGLRRVQALAPMTPLGLQITHYLLDRRLLEQARISGDLLDRLDIATAIEDRRAALSTVRNVAEAMTIEAQAGDYFWRAWEPLEARFATKDRHRVPEHWPRFGQRRSPLGSKTNRQAVNVPNALLNYGYRLAEIEATIAAFAMGLDPAVGLLHADGPSRSSLALDLLEPVRGLVETVVISLCRNHTWRKVDFHERPNGELRMLPPVSHELAGILMPALRDQLAPVAEHVATTLATLGPTDLRIPTHLSETARGRVARTTRVRQLERRCRGCGRILTEPGSRRVYCAQCLPEAARRRRKLVYGRQPTQPRQYRKAAYATVRGAKKAAAEVARHDQQRAWEDEHAGMARPDPALFAPIRASLTTIPIREIMAATGLASSSATMIRSGRLLPHARHWPALAKLASVRNPIEEP